MKKRTKLALIAMSLCLVVALGVIGIFAVKTLNMTVGGNITFTADGILASISKGTMAGGNYVTPADETTKMLPVEVTTNKTETQLVSELASWQGLNFEFAKSGADVTITFTIKNNSTAANSYIDVKTTIDNGTANNAYADVSPSWVVIDPGATQTFVITLSVITTEINASLTDFVVGFALSQTNTKTQTTNLSFDVGTAGNAANFPTTSYAVGSVIESLAEPTMTNKCFEGWYTDAAMTQKVEFPFTITADTKLYAKFTSGTLAAASYKYDSASDSYHVVRNTTSGYTFPEVVIIPDEYEGPNGTKPVTKIVDGSNNTTSALGYNDTIKEIYVGNNVTYIGKAAFRNNPTLQKIVMSNSVKELSTEGYHFTNCTSLKDVTLSNQIPEIPYGSFYNTGIENLDFIPASVITTGQQAFSTCNSLVEVTIPKTLINLGSYLFAFSANLTNANLHSKIEVAGGHPFFETPYYENVKNKIVSYYDIPNSKVLVRVDATITSTTQIPGYETVTHIAPCSFINISLEQGTIVNNTSLKTVDLPLLKKVASTAFLYCVALTTVNAPNVEEVGARAFYLCAAMENVTFGNLKSVGDYAFHSCAKLPNVNLINASYVGLASFYGCASITSVDMPTIKTVGYAAFHSCKALTTVNVPQAESIEGFAFNDCTNLSSIEMSNVKYIGDAGFQYCKNLEINLHEGLLWAGNFAFNHCENSTQTQIVIPSTLVQLGGKEFVGDNEDNALVGSHLFYNCATASLTEFVVAQGNQHFKTHQGVLYTKTYKYMISYPSANTRTSYEMPEGCEEIFELCFSRPHFLKTLTIPNSFNIRRVSGEYAYNHPEMNNISNALYHYSAVDNIIIKSDNPNFKSINGVVYSKDGTEVIAVPTAYSKGQVLTFADSCTTINAIPFFYALGSEPTYNGNKVGKGPTGILIGANVKTISDEALEAINSYSWTITSNSPYYTVNSEGKLVRV